MANDSVLMRRAELADVGRLQALEIASFVTDRISERQMRYLVRQAKAEVWVLCVNEYIVAYACMLLPRLPRAARLYSVAVANNHQRLGFGGRLLKALLTRAAELGYRKMRLEVNSQQQHVQNLYSANGFVMVKPLPSFYENGCDALQMQIDLPPRV